MNIPKEDKFYNSGQQRCQKTTRQGASIETITRKKPSINLLSKMTTAFLVLSFIATTQLAAINNNNLASAQSETPRPIVTMSCSPVEDGSGAIDVNINIENLDTNSQYVYLFNRTSDASQVWTGSLPSQVQQYTTTIRVPAPVPPDEQFLFYLERITDDGREFAAAKVIRCDQIPPNSSINSATDNAGNNIRNTSATISDSITFEFSSPDSDVSGFECFLSTAGDNLAENCTSPKTYSNLEEGQYQFTVIATDIAGNRDPTGPVFVWTVQPGDTTAPEVISIDPADGATDVPVDIPAITATFSENVIAVNRSTFTVSSVDGAAVPGTVTYDSSTWTATFTPSQDLAYETEYRASLSSAIRDRAFNPLTATEWSFTTESESSGNTSSDLDLDGIHNEVDPDDSDPSNDSFETSSGTSGILIRSEPNQNLTVTPNNEGGVTITVFFGGPVHVEACSGQEIHDLEVGESIDIVCGSITIRVNEGDIELILHGDDGTSLTVNLQEGHDMTFEPQDNTITTPSSNPGPITAISETGEEITVSPGESVQAAYSMEGFYPPIDMNQVENIARAGQTIPFKFEVFFGTTEITDTDAVNFSQEAIECLNEASDGVEQTTTGDTRLVYDESSGQFVGHWKSPRTPSTCYEVSASVVENSSVEKTAIVRLR